MSDDAATLLRRSRSVLITAASDQPGDLFKPERLAVIDRLIKDINAALNVDRGTAA